MATLTMSDRSINMVEAIFCLFFLKKNSCTFSSEPSNQREYSWGVFRQHDLRKEYATSFTFQ